MKLKSTHLAFFTLLSFYCSLLSPHLIAQPCGWDGITFSSQEEVDSFHVNYPNCTFINGNVEISGDDIINLNGLHDVICIGGDLYIHENPLLVNLTGLEDLESLGGGLEIMGNDSLENLTGLNNLGSVKEYVIIGGDLPNPSLTSLEGLEDLDAIGFYLHISNNPVLTNLTALSNLVSVEWGLKIGDYTRPNPMLTSLEGLEGLTAIGHSLVISYNDSLSDLTGLNNIVSIGDGLAIHDNPNLTSLSGLENLTSIGGDVAIGSFIFGGGNPSLATLSGLENLTSVNGNFAITDNPSLTSLEALSGLNTIGGHLHIGTTSFWNSGNDSLTSLEGLGNIAPGSISKLTINSNQSLSHCAVTSICDYLASPSADITIVGNGEGCISPEEVQKTCDLINSISTSKIEDTFTIYPNPCSGAAHLKISNINLWDPFGKQQTIKLEVFTISGMMIKELMNEEKLPGTFKTEIDLSDLIPGIYFCVLKTDQYTTTQKIIKLN